MCPECVTCDSLHVCYTFFLSLDLLKNRETGKYHKLLGCDGESYKYGDEITAENEKEYAKYIKGILQGDDGE